MRGLLYGFIFGVFAAWGVGSIGAQMPAAPPNDAQEIIMKYAQGQEKAYRECSVELAKEQVKSDRFQKDAADAKAALAKAGEPKK